MLELFFEIIITRGLTLLRIAAPVIKGFDLSIRMKESELTLKMFLWPIKELWLGKRSNLNGIKTKYFRSLFDALTVIVNPQQIGFKGPSVGLMAFLLSLLLRVCSLSRSPGYKFCQLPLLAELHCEPISD